MSAITSIFGGKPKQDTSQLDRIRKENEKQAALLKEKEDREKEEEASTLRAIRSNSFSGPRTLFGLVTGVEKPGTATAAAGKKVGTAKNLSGNA